MLHLKQGRHAEGRRWLRRGRPSAHRAGQHACDLDYWAANSRERQATAAAGEGAPEALLARAAEAHCALADRHAECPETLGLAIAGCAKSYFALWGRPVEELEGGVLAAATMRERVGRVLLLAEKLGGTAAGGGDGSPGAAYVQQGHALLKEAERLNAHMYKYTHS